MSTGMIIVAVIVFFATQLYMKKRCEAEKRKLARNMIINLMLVEDQSIPQDTEHFCYRGVMSKLTDAERRSYITAENYYFNCISEAAYYRLRDQLELNGKYEKLLAAIKSEVLTPEQREQYWKLRGIYLPDEE